MQLYELTGDIQEYAEDFLKSFKERGIEFKIKSNLNEPFPGEAYYILIECGGWNYLRVDFSPYPANCGIVILSDLECYLGFIWEKEKEVWEFVLQLCKTMGYSQVQYTTAGFQGSLSRKLKKFGFEVGSSFRNKRSGSTVKCWYKNI